MAHAHEVVHGAAANRRRHRGAERRGLSLATATTATILVAEAVGGWLSNSLALLADAGHMLSDLLALLLAIAALSLASRPATDSKTYGWYRLEILVALVNGVALVLISLFIFWEAWSRLFAPPDVGTGLMMGVAVVGLAANALALYFLSGHGHSLNVRGAYLHVLGDLLSSIGVVLGGAVMWFTGAYWVDPAISAAIGVVIVIGAWRLLEATPAGISAAEVARAICEIDGVEGVHDLHIWSLTSGMYALSCHVEVSAERIDEVEPLLEAVPQMLRRRFAIDHTTIQIETPHFKHRRAVHWRTMEGQRVG